MSPVCNIEDLPPQMAIAIFGRQVYEAWLEWKAREIGPATYEITSVNHRDGVVTLRPVKGEETMAAKATKKSGKAPAKKAPKVTKTPAAKKAPATTQGATRRRKKKKASKKA